MIRWRSYIHKDDYSNNNEFAGCNIFHLSTAVCVTYLILAILGSTGLSVVVTFVFNMAYLLYGKTTMIWQI